MGLDQYLEGEETFDYSHRKKVKGDIELKGHTYRLGYWRKHPNLHGYIVQEFAKGVDECQRIDLESDDLKKILEASEADELPETAGFFFGHSCPEDKEETKKILEAAIEWLESPEEGTWRSVYYQASW